jgi:hypothetical protein
VPPPPALLLANAPFCANNCEPGDDISEHAASRDVPRRITGKIIRFNDIGPPSAMGAEIMVSDSIADELFTC